MRAVLARLTAIDGRLATLTRMMQEVRLAPSTPPATPPPSPAEGAAPDVVVAVDVDGLIAFDLETTGLGKTSAIRVREIGAVAVSNQPCEPFRSAVNPGVDIAVSAAAKKISPDPPDMATAPQWSGVGPKFHAWLEAVRKQCPSPDAKIVLMGYNSKRYDSRILAFENCRHNVRTEPTALHFVDLMPVLRKHVPEVEKPRTLARYHAHLLGRPIASAHTALGDAVAVRDIWRAIDCEEVRKLMQAEIERADGVYKRCGLPVPPSGCD